MLHVFSEQRIAASLKRGCDDERIIEGEAMIASEQESGLVGRYPEVAHASRSTAHKSKRRLDIEPRPVELAPCNIGKLIQHLNADRASRGQEPFRGWAAWIIRQNGLLPH